MKELFRLAGVKFLVIGNLFYFVMTALAKAGDAIAGLFGKIPLAGNILASVVKFIFIPFRAASKFSKVILIIDVVLAILLLVLTILKKRQQKKATAELGEAIGSEEKATGFAKLMKAFK